jgi:hypothetical protein
MHGQENIKLSDSVKQTFCLAAPSEFGPKMALACFKFQ